jgi:hypothetical protein
MGDKNENLALRIIFVHTCKWFLTCLKILWNGADGFTSPPKEGVLRIFIALKNQSPRPGLNPRTLGPVASTLTITPPRWQWRYSFMNSSSDGGGVYRHTSSCFTVWKRGLYPLYPLDRRLGGPRAHLDPVAKGYLERFSYRVSRNKLAIN